ncbi:hypothetical protein [Streptomyces sp. TP-A0874]|uniref:hypothetical protein n=1 Tax=Streptomyces sp. TP-A0874 TaxID=549819 RepID=UPI000852E657|nr:hypothetical protein [Streptomyces sp. TP-A0874]
MAERNDIGAGSGDGENREPFDEEAAWAAIVAGYDKVPESPGEDGRGVDLPAGGPVPDAGADHGTDPSEGAPEAAVADDERQPRPDVPPPSDRPLGSSVVIFSAGLGPRDWTPRELTPKEAEAEDRFVPPEPPPLPKGDPTSRMAWVAVLGGPLLLLLMVLMQWEMRSWVTFLGVGGFLGGFATLVARMRDGDEDDEDDPGRGAVV